MPPRSVIPISQATKAVSVLAAPVTSVLATAAPDVISPTDYEISSQFAHFFTAAFLVSQFGMFGGLKWLAISSVAMLAFATWKEFWYDPRHENPLVRGSSPRDFTLYVSGIALADALFFVARHFHHV